MAQTQMLEQLQAWLQNHSPQDLLMPLLMIRGEDGRVSKAPKHAHKNGAWSWERFNNEPVQDTPNVGILMRTLICIDADTPEAEKYVEERWGHATCTTTQAKTTKGTHHVFQRTDLCDQLGITDKARGMRVFGETGVLEIDIKTVTRTGTAGVLSVCPSEGKKWVRAPWDCAPKPLPDDIARDIAGMTVNGRPKQQVRPRPGRPARDPLHNAPSQYQQHVALMQKEGFVNLRIKEVTDVGFQFIADHRLGDTKRCPLCNSFHKTHWWWAIPRQWRNYDIILTSAYSNDCCIKKFFLNRELVEFQLPLAPYSHIEQRTVRERWLPAADLDEDRVLASSSGCNTGKSTMMHDSVQEAANRLGKRVEDVRIVLLATRIAFADSRHSDLRDLGFVHYSQLHKQDFVGNVDKLVITLHSLHKIRFAFQDQLPYDMFWIDEAESVMSTFSCAATMNTRLTENTEAFEWLFQSSRWVFWMDGTPTSRGLNSLNNLCRLTDRKAILTVNQYPAQHGRTAHKFNNRRQLEDFVVQKIVGGERMEIVVGSKKHGTELKARLDTQYAGKVILFYHMGMAVEMQKTLKDVNRTWAKADVVMFTATVLNGIDFHVKGHFDSAAVFGCPGRGPCTRDLMQMLHRVRDLTTGQVYFNIESAFGVQPIVTMKGIAANVDAQARLAFAHASDSKKISVHARLLDSSTGWLRETNYGNILENNLGMVYADASFTMWLTAAGYDVREVEAPEKKRRIKKADGAPASGTLRYVDIPQVHDAEFKQLQRLVYARQNSTAEYWTVQRHLFDRTIDCGKDSAVIFDALHSDSGFRNRFYNLLAEHRKDPADMMAKDMNECGSAAMANKRGRALQIVKQLCDILGIHTTHDTASEVTESHVDKNCQRLQALSEEYASIYAMRERGREGARGRCATTVVMTSSGRVLHHYSGHKFCSVRREGSDRTHVWKLKTGFPLLNIVGDRLCLK